MEAKPLKFEESFDFSEADTADLEHMIGEAARKSKSTIKIEQIDEANFEPTDKKYIEDSFDTKMTENDANDDEEYAPNDDSQDDDLKT
jgi:hypothetical protein